MLSLMRSAGFHRTILLQRNVTHNFFTQPQTTKATNRDPSNLKLMVNC
jgi:hypothetical protein